MSTNTVRYPRRENVYIALLHHPVYNKRGETISAAVTNLDIHDIARLAKTYGLGGYYLVTPVTSQYKLMLETIDHWRSGIGHEYNPDRSEAFMNVQAVKTVQEVEKAVGRGAMWVITTARQYPRSIGFDEIRAWGEANPDQNIVIAFGTGYGLTDEFIESYEFVLTPIDPGTGYNHLSVRSAVSIIIDRLFR